MPRPPKSRRHRSCEWCLWFIDWRGTYMMIDSEPNDGQCDSPDGPEAGMAKRHDDECGAFETDEETIEELRAEHRVPYLVAARRRRDAVRMKNKARRLYPGNPCPQRYAEHLAVCSCSMCENPRRRGELTVQERRAAAMVKDTG